MKLSIITSQVCNLCRETGKFIHDEIYKLSKENIERKDKNNFVTYVDKESEMRLVEKLHKIIPTSGFIVEENTIKQKNEEYMWIIDPLDGTTNYIHHIPIYSISVALMFKNEIILGVVFEINSQECFYAWKGSPAYLNGKTIHTSKTKNLEEAFLSTGFPYSDFDRLDNYISFLRESMQITRGIRRLGSAAIDLAYIACGRFDIFFEYGLNPWDVAAGSFIVQQAGGRSTDFSNGDNYIFGKEIVSTNNLIHETFIKLINKYFA